MNEVERCSWCGAALVRVCVSELEGLQHTLSQWLTEHPVDGEGEQ